MTIVTDRRQVLVTGALATLATAFAPRMAFARAATAKRFVFIIQRGGADGMGIVGPVGDPGFVGMRGDLAADVANGTKLDAMFALHPAMQATAALYGQGQALFAHAIASPYRDRSHFDGQNVLETGGVSAYQLKDGWLNRLLAVVPHEDAHAIAIAATVPMALRGSHEVASYAPSSLPQASDDLMSRVAMLYQGDAQLHGLWSEAMATRQLTSDLTQNNGADAAATGALTARLLAPDNGARIAMIETGGWDTHTAQRQRLGAQLKGLDAMVGALRTGLGPLWDDTLILVATEFGRTVAANGTGGTDHGQGSSAMLLGGAVRGGRVVADWPGLARGQLYEGRDLNPTASLDAFIGGAVAGHFATDPARTMATLFPASARARPTEGLIRSGADACRYDRDVMLPPKSAERRMGYVGPIRS